MRSKEARAAVVYRPFAPQDLAELMSMIVALYREDSEGEPIAEAKIERTVQELTRYPGKGEIILFAVDQTIVDYALLIFFWSNEYGGNIVHIDELYIKESWRKQGIATQFLDHLASSQPETTRGLQLEVTPSNERTWDYYRRLGFRPSANRHLLKKLGE